MNPLRTRLERKIRRLLLFSIVGLILSGATAFPLETEMGSLAGHWPLGRGRSLYGWVSIDCSFGVIGFVPLYLCHRAIRRLSALHIIGGLQELV